jgi:hypothetical protein
MTSHLPRPRVCVRTGAAVVAPALIHACVCVVGFAVAAFTPTPIALSTLSAVTTSSTPAPALIALACGLDVAIVLLPALSIWSLGLACAAFRLDPFSPSAIDGSFCTIELRLFLSLLPSSFHHFPFRHGPLFRQLLFSLLLRFPKASFAFTLPLVACFVRLNYGFLCLYYRVHFITLSSHLGPLSRQHLVVPSLFFPKASSLDAALTLPRFPSLVTCFVRLNYGFLCLYYRVHFITLSSHLGPLSRQHLVVPSLFFPKASSLDAALTLPRFPPLVACFVRLNYGFLCLYYRVHFITFLPITAPTSTSSPLLARPGWRWSVFLFLLFQSINASVA